MFVNLPNSPVLPQYCDYADHGGFKVLVVLPSYNIILICVLCKATLMELNYVVGGIVMIILGAAGFEYAGQIYLVQKIAVELVTYFQFASLALSATGIAMMAYGAVKKEDEIKAFSLKS